MMSRSGLIIRLIDIALIILFGFIAISDIKVNAQIKLPATKLNRSTASRSHFILIKVRPEGNCLIVDGEAQQIAEELPEVEAYLLARRENDRRQGLALHVLIQPEEDSIVQRVVDLLDLCAKLKIPKNIAYDYSGLRL